MPSIGYNLDRTGDSVAKAQRENLEATRTAFVRRLLDPAIPLSLPMFGHVTVQGDWNVPPRRLPLHLFYFVTRHAIAARFDEDAEVTIQPGTLLWIAPNTLHALRIPPDSPPFTVYFLRMDLRTSSRARTVSPGHRVLLVPHAAELEPHLRSIVREIHNPRDSLIAERVRAHLVLLVTGAFRLSDAQDARPGKPGRLSRAQQETILDQIGDDPTARCTPDDLAAGLDLSHDYFTRLFRRTFGMPPRAWLLRERIRRAAQRLVDSTASVSRVAAEFGYDDAFLFSRQFKKVMGQSPRAYRSSPTTR